MTSGAGAWCGMQARPSQKALRWQAPCACALPSTLPVHLQKHNRAACIHPQRTPMCTYLQGHQHGSRNDAPHAATLHH